MPNHVYNTLITEKPLTVKILHEQSKELNGGLAMLVMPRPTDQEENWYSWNCNNWGTKWGCYDQQILGQDNEMISFTTAWDTISTHVLNRLAKHFPNLTLMYEEENGWGGEIVYSNGEITSHRIYTEPEWGEDVETEGGDEVWKLKKDYQRLDEFYPKGWYYHGDLEDPVTNLDILRSIQVN